MHLCRLILRQQAQFMMEPVAKHKKRKSKNKKEHASALASAESEPGAPTPEPGPSTEPPLKKFVRTRRDEKRGKGRPKQQSGPSLDFSKSKDNYKMKQYDLLNDGHTIRMLNFVPETGLTPSFLWPEQDDGVYCLTQVHFHWGPHDNVGSEHRIDGKAFSVEMHLVHYRCLKGKNGFPDFNSALLSEKGNAIAVIGVFLQVDNKVQETFLQPHIYTFSKVPRKNDMINVSGHGATLRRSGDGEGHGGLYLYGKLNNS